MRKTLKINKSSIDVFDFKNHWHLVTPHLHHPRVEAALIREGFDLQEGPWSQTRTSLWLEKVSSRYSDAVARGEVEDLGDPEDWADESDYVDREYEARSAFNPKPGTYEWYQSFHDCHRLAPFLKELGKRVFPLLNWRILSGDDHSLAYGADRIGNIIRIFDILNFDQMSAIELLDFATRQSITAHGSAEDDRYAPPEFSHQTAAISLTE
jgi:hypothetical protein